MFRKEDYDKLRKEVLDFAPDKIIDAHIHTGTKAGDVDAGKKKPHPLSYGLMKNRLLTVPKGLFSKVFSGRDVRVVGFPLPLPFAHHAQGIHANSSLWFLGQCHTKRIPRSMSRAPHC